MKRRMSTGKALKHGFIFFPQYGSTAGDEPAKSFEEARKKFKKEFDMVKLESPSWTIEVPLRKKNTLSKH